MLPFRHPSTILIAGPTGCGKTQFLLKLLTSNNAIDPAPERITWVYSEWQPAYDALKRVLGWCTRFIKDYEATELYNSIDPNYRNVLVLDDQMGCDGTCGGDGAVTLTKLFTQGSHHRNLTVVYVVQNLFNKDRTMRTVNLNSHYQVLFKNPRDKTQVRTLGQQMYPGNSHFLVDAFEDATAAPYSYMVLDLRPETPEDIRVRAKVFDEDAVVYVPTSERGPIKARRGGQVRPK